MADPTGTAPAPATTPAPGGTPGQTPPATGTAPAAPAAAATPAQGQPATGAAPAAPAAGATAPAAGTPAPAASKTETTPAAPAVPEKYELKMPEKSPLAAAHLEKVAAIAKEQGLSQEEAQAFLEHDHEVASSVVAAQLENVKVQQDEWKKASVADPEIGGAKLAENAEYTKRFLDRYGSLEMKHILDASGFGNHPEVVRTFSRVYRDLMASGQVVIPSGEPGASALPQGGPHYTKDAAMAQQLYGKKEGT